MGMMEKSQYQSRGAIHAILKSLKHDEEQTQWVRCPVCGFDWNKLTPNGVCVECDLPEAA